MRLMTIMHPICLAICAGAVFVTLEAYPVKEVSTYLNLSNIALFITTLYYFDVTCKTLGFPSCLGTVERNYRTCFCYDFMITVVYWLMRLYNKGYLYDGSYAKPEWYNIFVHGGLFILLVLEYFLWRRHLPVIEDYISMIVFGLVITALIYVPWFAFHYSVYPFVRSFSPEEFVLLPCLIIILLFVAVRGYTILTLQKSSDEANKLIDVSFSI